MIEQLDEYQLTAQVVRSVPICAAFAQNVSQAGLVECPVADGRAALRAFETVQVVRLSLVNGMPRGD